MSDRVAADELAAFDKLRERWERAKASGTTLAFAAEMLADPVPLPPLDAYEYESEAERCAYEQARADFKMDPADLLAILPYYFGDERGIPIEELFAELGIDKLDDGEAPDGVR